MGAPGALPAPGSSGAGEGGGEFAGSLREDLFAALDLLLRRAQQAGAVRPGVRTSDLIVLLKGMFASLAGSTDPALRELVFAVLTDGLRPPRGSPAGDTVRGRVPHRPHCPRQ